MTKGSTLKVHAFPGHSATQPALVASLYNGVPLEVASVKDMASLKSDDFTKKNPMQKIPVLETSDGFIPESGAILRYVVRAGHDVGLYGNNIFEMGQVDRWIDFAQVEVRANLAPWIYPVLGYAEFNSDVTEAAKTKTKRVLKVLNDHLLSRTFLVGERITAADLAVFFAMKSAFEKLFEPSFRKDFSNVTRWFTTLMEQPEFKDKKVGMGSFKLCDKMAVAGKGGASSSSTSSSAQAAEPAAEKPKGPHWSSSLEKSPFDLEAWKRYYSNANDTRGDAMPWFWKHYDPKGFSLWKATYKYPEDNTSELQCRNLIGGTFQRLEPARKYAFGVVAIFNDPLTMYGYWVFRGQEIPPEVKESPDYSSWNYTKVEKLDDETKELIADYWSWEGKFGGLKFSDEAKVFK